MLNLHPLFRFFNHNRPIISSNKSERPDAWKTVEYKTYPRLPKIKLPKPDLDDTTLKDAILRRKSERNFSDKPFSLAQLSTLLFYSAGIIHSKADTNMNRRAYPSGGARYPIEIYPIVLNVEGVDSGVYHYNCLDHGLEYLLKTENDEITKSLNYKFIKEAGVVFVFTMVPERSAVKYGNFSFKLMLIESGHIAENFYLINSAMGLKCCAIGGARDEVHELLDIDGTSEIAFYILAAGT